MAKSLSPGVYEMSSFFTASRRASSASPEQGMILRWGNFSWSWWMLCSADGRSALFAAMIMGLESFLSVVQIVRR